MPSNVLTEYGITEDLSKSDGRVELPRIDIFPHDRNVMVSKAVAAYAAKHARHAESQTIIDNPFGMLVKYVTSRLPVPQVAETHTHAVSATQTPSPAADNPETAIISLGALASTIADKEIQEQQDAGHKFPTSQYLTRRIATALQGVVWAASGYTNKNEKIVVKEVFDDRNPQGTYKLFTDTVNGTHTSISYWGRVVDLTTAKNISKQNLLCMGDNQGRGPLMYLDGSAVNSFHNSTVCVAWMVKPQAKQSTLLKKRTGASREPEFEIHDKKFRIVIDGVEYHYSRPILVDVATGGAGPGSPHTRPIEAPVITAEPADAETAPPSMIVTGVTGTESNTDMAEPEHDANMSLVFI